MLTKELRGDAQVVQVSARVILMDYDFQNPLAEFELNKSEKDRVIKELEESGSDFREIRKNDYWAVDDGNGVMVKKLSQCVDIRCYLSDFIKIFLANSFVTDDREITVYVTGKGRDLKLIL